MADSGADRRPFDLRMFLGHDRVVRLNWIIDGKLHRVAIRVQSSNQAIREVVVDVDREHLNGRLQGHLLDDPRGKRLLVLDDHVGIDPDQQLELVGAFMNVPYSARLASMLARSRNMM